MCFNAKSIHDMFYDSFYFPTRLKNLLSVSFREIKSRLFQRWPVRLISNFNKYDTFDFRGLSPSKHLHSTAPHKQSQFGW